MYYVFAMPGITISYRFILVQCENNFKWQTYRSGTLLLLQLLRLYALAISCTLLRSSAYDFNTSDTTNRLRIGQQTRKKIEEMEQSIPTGPSERFTRNIWSRDKVNDRMRRQSFWHGKRLSATLVFRTKT